MSNQEKPLAGLRVLDLTQVAAGPYATMLLADAGAEVIKVERPQKGEIAREIGPFRENESGQQMSAGILSYCRNKKSIALNLKHPKGRDIFKRLVKVSDLVVENFAPGTMSDLGLSYEVLREVNPGLIYASVSGFGHRETLPGPYWQRPSFNAIAQAMGGLNEVTGEPGGPPVETGAPVADIFPGTLAVCGILMALYQRQRTGIGQQIDVAMYDAMVSMLTARVIDYLMSGQVVPRGVKPGSAPNTLFKTRDGYVAIGVVGEDLWVKFCQAIGQPELVSRPGLEDGVQRSKNLETILRPIIESWAADKSKDEVTEIMLNHGVPAGPVQTIADILNCPHLQARQMLTYDEHPVAGRIIHVGTPIKLSAYPDPTYAPPPLLGEHTEEVLTSLLGLSPPEMAQLRAEGVL